jgi:signal transduction histidine kinase/ActR/RegA family two-component response regulator
MTGADQATASSGPLDWRHKLLEWLAVSAFALASIAFPVVTVLAVTVTHPFWMAVMLGLYLLLTLATFARRLPYVARALALLVALGSVALLGLARVGYQVGPGTGSALIVILSGLLLGRRAMLGAFALTLCAIPAVGVYTQQSGGSFLAPGVNDPTQLANWWRVAAVYALFTGVLAAAVSFVVDHIQHLLAQRTEALERLHAASLLKQEAEHALGDAQRTISQMQKLEALGRLAGGVAHDFNNSLVVILGYADMLRARAQPDPEIERGLSEIITAGNHAAGLTRKLLSFGRRAVSVPRALAPSQALTEIEGMLRRVLPENIELHLVVDNDLPAVFADPGELQQVLLNLCMNARDAMPSGGLLTMRATRRVANGSEWLAIEVQDTGCGMDEHTRTHAFDPFFTTKGERGTGLGLSTVYGIIGQNGGHVWVDSELGRGSRFTLLLPPCAFEVESEEAELTARPRKPSTILIAEDEPPVRELIQAAFRAAGHTVLAATNGSEALAIARRYRGAIDLLCTDGVMPGSTSSRQLIEGFRAVYPHAGVLVCSGHAEELVLDPELLAEISYLQKPFTVEKLLRSVGETLDGMDTARA